MYNDLVYLKIASESPLPLQKKKQNKEKKKNNTTTSNLYSRLIL